MGSSPSPQHSVNNSTVNWDIPQALVLMLMGVETMFPEKSTPGPSRKRGESYLRTSMEHSSRSTHQVHSLGDPPVTLSYCWAEIELTVCLLGSDDTKGWVIFVLSPYLAL